MVTSQLEDARASVARLQEEMRDYKGRAQALLSKKDAEVSRAGLSWPELS